MKSPRRSAWAAWRGLPRARHQARRIVAVKVLPAQLTDSPAALSRFEPEAKAVAALTHPNILSIFDFGREGADVYAGIKYYMVLVPDAFA